MLNYGNLARTHYNTVTIIITIRFYFDSRRVNRQIKMTATFSCYCKYCYYYVVCMLINLELMLDEVVVTALVEVFL